MDILPLHIEYLLTRHDCVIVPGFGAFIASEKEAYIDLERMTIYPRRREISFNRSVVTDDGLLSHSIARHEAISYEDARGLLAHLTEKMLTDLDEEGEVSMGMVGSLYRDDERLVSFKPRFSSIESDIFGEVKLIEASKSDQASTPDTDAVTVKEDAEDDGMRTIRVRTDRYVFTVPKRLVKVAAMVVAVFAACLSLLVPMNLDNEQKASVISIEDFFHNPAKTDEAPMKKSVSVLPLENDTAHQPAPECIQ